MSDAAVMSLEFSEVAQRTCRELAMNVQKQNESEASARVPCAAPASTAPPARPAWPAHRRFWHRALGTPNGEPSAPRPAEVAPGQPAEAA